MADIAVRAPNGAIVEVPQEDYQKALDAGYSNISAEEAQAARSAYAGQVGAGQAVTEGVLEAAPGYDVARAAAQKALSAASFGLAPGLDSPEARAVGKRFQAEHPVGAFAAEVAGQVPAGAALELATAGVAPLVAGAGRAARAAFTAGEFSAQAAVGGAQTEAERARLEGDGFSVANAAIAGVVGEAFGRTAGAGFSAALGARRNLIARATQRAVEQDTAEALSRGGFMNDFRIAAHADQYQNELSRLAADDLDALETNFAEVSRQDRKRARITRVVEDHPVEQAAVRSEALGEMQKLYEALYTEIGDQAAPGPARQLLDQLRKRMDLLGERPTGARLWRLLDENRQALQEYAQDLYQAYDTAPGSAWLSRESLSRLDASERVTRETLLREDVWGQVAAREQAAYNKPFNEKYFPTARTVRGKLMFTTGTDARGFPIFRGDPGRVRSFFTRGVDDVDAARLGEQFREYLDGVEAIARAGERDTPVAARNTLEAVRRLRKAMTHAEFIAETAARMGRRADVAEVGLGVGAGLLGAAGGGVHGAAAGGLAGQTVRGLRLVHWLSEAARKLGWAGDPKSMERLLAKGRLPRRFGPDTPVDLIDDLTVPGRGPTEPPPSGGMPPPAAPGGGGGPGVPPPVPGGPGGAGAPAGRGLTPSMLAEARRGSWTPSGPPSDTPGGVTGIDELAPEPAPSAVRPGRNTRAARETTPVAGREVHRGQREAEQLDPLREAGAAGRREAERLQALTEGEFRDVVQQLRASDTPEADRLADAIESRAEELRSAGLVDDAARPSRAATAAPPPAGPVDVKSLADVAKYYEQRASQESPDLARFIEKAKGAVKGGRAAELALVDQANGAAAELTPGELDAVLSYTQRRGDKVGTDEWRSALNKLAVDEPTQAGPLYHGTRMTPEELGALLRDGEFKAGDKPMSLSFEQYLSEGFSHERPDRGASRVLFKIDRLGRGYNLMSPSTGFHGVGGEREILLADPTVFDVVGHSTEDDLTTVTLREKAKEDAFALLANRVTGSQGGVTPGGFFKGADGKMRYVKFQRPDRQLSEFANAQAYRDFGVRSIEQEIHRVPVSQVEELAAAADVDVWRLKEMKTGKNGELLLLVSEKMPDDWRPIGGTRGVDIMPSAIDEYIEGNPADITLGNIDLAANGGNLMTNGSRVLRLDAGEAGPNVMGAMRLGRNDDWEEFTDALRGAAAMEDRLYMPHALLATRTLEQAKAPLQRGLDRIRTAIDNAGGFPAYVDKRYDHLDPSTRSDLAKMMKERFNFIQKNIGALAVLALLTSAAVTSATPAPEGAAPEASQASAGFMAAAALFNRSAGRVIAQAAKRLFSLTAEPAVKATARLMYSRSQIEARRAELTAWHQNPEAPGGLIDRVSEGFRDAPPEAFAAASAASYRALAFLRARLPQSGQPAPIAATRGVPVSSEAAMKYARYEQAALYPGDAIREASESGYLSTELLETLAELYPETLAELRVAAYQAVQDAGPRSLSIQAKTQYARLFDGRGELADPTFSSEATMVYAAAYEQAAASQPPKTGAGPRPGVSQTARAVAAPQPWRTA